MFKKKKAFFRILLLSAFVLSAIVPAVVAQIDTASLTGQVTDAQGAVVAGARVVATNQATNISVETTTNDEGYYTFANLRPSLYTVEAAQANFKTDSRKNYELNIGQRARLDFQLSVGDASAIVDVTTENQSLIQREDASLGNVVDNRRVTTLPLPQRSWDDLLTQVAGTQGDPYTEQSGGTALGRTGSVNIHGIRSLYNNFILDGHEAGKIAGALCHGVAILKYARLSNGELLARGKTVTGFANAEEDFADNAVWDYGMLARGQNIMPWRIEDAMKEVGANYIQAGLWRAFAVRDGNLITGQQNFSGGETAKIVIEALGE